MIEIQDEEYNQILNKKMKAHLTWKEVLMKGVDNI